MSWANAPPPSQRATDHYLATWFAEHERQGDERGEDMATRLWMRTDDGRRWEPTHRGQTAQPIAPTMAFRRALSGGLFDLSMACVRGPLLVERTYSLWPDDLKARWHRHATEMNAAINRVMQAMKTFAGQIDTHLLLRLDQVDAMANTVFPLRRSPYTMHMNTPYLGRIPLDELANRVVEVGNDADGVLRVTRRNIEQMFAVAESLTQDLREAATDMQLGVMHARELASTDQHLRHITLDTWHGAYENFALSKYLMTFIGTATRPAPTRTGPPRTSTAGEPVWARGRTDYHGPFPDQQTAIRRPRDPPPPPQSTANDPATNRLRHEVAALQAANKVYTHVLPARLAKAQWETASFDPTGGEQGGVSYEESSQHPQVVPSASGDFDPTAWLQRRVKIPRVAPKVAGSSAADFDPTAWLQRRVKIPRQTPKAAPSGSAGGKYRYSL